MCQSSNNANSLDGSELMLAKRKCFARWIRIVTSDLPDETEENPWKSLHVWRSRELWRLFIEYFWLRYQARKDEAALLVQEFRSRHGFVYATPPGNPFHDADSDCDFEDGGSRTENEDVDLPVLHRPELEQNRRAARKEARRKEREHKSVSQLVSLT